MRLFFFSDGLFERLRLLRISGVVMVIDFMRQIEYFSSSDYVGALRRIAPTERQWDMLRIHLAAPDHTITARHLALGLGFTKWHIANLHYGKFAGKLCKEMKVAPETQLAVLVEFFKFPGFEYQLRLRPSVIGALNELGFDSRNAWFMQEELGTEQQLVEGASFTVQVNAFERNPVARRKCIAHYGSNCAACGFSFGEAYGLAAEGYLHVHHLTPLASIGEQYVIDLIKDLRPVCANCHAVIHLRQPPYSIEELKCLLRGGAESSQTQARLHS